jgi:hypothetical protein
MPPRRPTTRDPLEQAIEAALEPGRFIKYAAGQPFVEGLERVERRIAKLVRGAPARAVTLYETYLAGASSRPCWISTPPSSPDGPAAPGRATSSRRTPLGRCSAKLSTRFSRR